MNEERPTWHVMRQPDTDWHEQAARRFDGTIPAGVFAARPVLDPQQPTPDREWHLERRQDGSVYVYYTWPNSQDEIVVWDSLDAGWNLQPPLIPDASTPVWASEMGMAPPTTEQQLRVRIITLEHELTIKQKQVELFAAEIVEYAPIYNAARLAADDMTTVARHWTFHVISDLSNLRALLRLLTPPAPKWETMLEDMEAARQFVASMENE